MPADLLAAPPPVTVAYTQGLVTSEDISWSILTSNDLALRLHQLMPGPRPFDEARQAHRSLARRPRAQLTRQSTTTFVDLLLSVIDLHDCRVVLDPWSDNKAVHQVLAARPLFIPNDRLGRKGVSLTYEPLEPVLYRKLTGTLGAIQAVVTIPPATLLDLAVITAVEFVTTVACFGAPISWAEADHVARGTYLSALAQEERLLWIRPAHPTAEFGWLCIFSSARAMQACLRPRHRQAHYTSTLWVER